MKPSSRHRAALFSIASSAAFVAALLSACDASLSRVLKPHDMVTMEFNDARLNLVVDGHGKVTAVRCG
jgi:hypothetical protein